MEKLVIERSKWACGNHRIGKDSELLTNFDQRCCLGFLGQACGLKDERALMVGHPHDLDGPLDVDVEWPSKLFESTSSYSSYLAYPPPRHEAYKVRNSWETIFILLNDSLRPADNDRESWIKEGFKHIFNIDLEFTGEYDPDAHN
jgi:hypothetical protein